MIKKKKRIKKEHKKIYDPILNADSMWNRETSIKKSKGGESIQQMLGFENDEDDVNITEKQPMKMMDIVLQAWDTKDNEVEEEDEPEEDDDE